MQAAWQINSFKKIKHGVLSPDFFFLCSEPIMQNLKGYPGIKKGHNISNLRHVVDTVFNAENKEDLQQLLEIIEEVSRKKGLELNSEKTEVIIMSRNNDCPQINIFVNGSKLKQRDKFKSLGTSISTTLKLHQEWRKQK